MTQLQSKMTKDQQEKDSQCEEVITEAIAEETGRKRRIPAIKVFLYNQKRNCGKGIFPSLLGLFVCLFGALFIFRNHSGINSLDESVEVKISLDTCMNINKAQTQQLVDNYKTINDLKNTVNTLNGSAEYDVATYTEEIEKLKKLVHEKDSALQAKIEELTDMQIKILNFENTGDTSIEMKIMEAILKQQGEEIEKLKQQVTQQNAEITNKDQKIRNLYDQINDYAIQQVTDIVMQKSNEYENCTSIIEDYSKNVSTLTNYLEVLKNEFPKVKIRMYLNEIISYDENRTYPCNLALFHKRYLRDDLVRHLISEHTYGVVVNTVQTREVVGLPIFGTLDNFFLLCYGEVFYVQVYISPYNDLSFSVMLYGPDEVASDFMYEVDVATSTDPFTTIRPTANCSSYVDPGYDYSLKVEKAAKSSFFFGKVKYSVRILRQ